MIEKYLDSIHGQFVTKAWGPEGVLTYHDLRDEPLQWVAFCKKSLNMGSILYRKISLNMGSFFSQKIIEILGLSPYEHPKIVKNGPIFREKKMSK